MTKKRDTFRFETRLPEFTREMERRLNMALNRIGLDWQKHSKLACPVDTGRLMSSITFSTPTQQATATPMGGEPFTPPEPPPFTAQVGTNVEYGPAVHEGIDAGTTIRVPRHSVRAHTRTTKSGTHTVSAHERGPFEYAHPGRAGSKFIERPGSERADEYQRMILEALKEGEP